jgi:hypothetical protein
MDYLDGKSLETILIEEGPLATERFQSIFCQVLEGLSFAHAKGLVHRDLKPANIFVTQPGPGIEVVKLIDFGIAKLNETSLRTTHNLTQTAEVFGTPAYMSPEQCLGFRVDQRSDIYSLGCVMYEALTGKPPFAGKNAVQIITKHLSAEPYPDARIHEFSDLIMSCLAKPAEERAKSAQAVLRSLQEVQPGEQGVRFSFGCDGATVSRNLTQLMRSKDLAAGPIRSAIDTYSFLGKAMWACALFTCATFFQPGWTMFAFGLLYAFCFSYFAAARERIRYLSRLIETSKPSPATLVAIGKYKGKRQLMRFAEDPGEIEFRVPDSRFENIRLPVTCDTWLDQKRTRVAADLEDRIICRFRYEDPFTHMDWLRLLFICMLLILHLQTALKTPGEVDFVANSGSLIMLVLLISTLVRGIRNGAIGVILCCAIPLALVFIFWLVCQFLSYFHVYLSHEQANLVARIIVSMVVFTWITYGLFKLLEFFGFVKVRKQRKKGSSI